MGASRPDKELAYGEQNVQPSAELNPPYGGQQHRRFTADYGEHNVRPLAELKPAYGGQ